MDRENCIAVRIPDDDDFFKNYGKKCMRMARAMTSPNLNCEINRNREQVIRKFCHGWVIISLAKYFVQYKKYYKSPENYKWHCWVRIDTHDKMLSNVPTKIQISGSDSPP